MARFHVGRTFAVAIPLLFNGVAFAQESPTTAPASSQEMPSTAAAATLAAAPVSGVEGGIYEKFRRTLVAVKFTWEGELLTRELIGGGVVVRDDGLVMVPLVFIHPAIPDAQMRDFKIVVPRSEEHTSELQSRQYLVCRLLLEKK